ncbi:MAG: DUF5715 family protein [Gemmatimonadota bacterium]|nr:DUF5715 family protein [Gemmatimonadota bacterium]
MTRSPSTFGRFGTGVASLATAGALTFAWAAIPAQAQSLRGSDRSLDRQNRAAIQHDFSFLETGAQVRKFADNGWLVRIRPNEDVELHAVSFPYARPEVELFIRRLGSQYRAACGERLVVTSLTRPATRQPRNASGRSVHPTGMAVDLRYSRDRRCRRWLEGVLVDLEKAGILEATRELRPAHYHVAVFPRQYAAYVRRMETRAVARMTVAQARGRVEAPYTVRPGDSLWTIARRHDTTVDELKAINQLPGSRIYAGQVLTVPLAGQEP